MHLRTTEERGFSETLDIQDRWTLPILLSLAFAVRLYLVFHTYVIANDGVLYVKLAKLISQGQIEEAIRLHFLNLFPFIISLFQKVFINWEFSGQMVSAIFGSLAIIPFYFLIKCLFNRSVAIISSILFVCHPYLVRFSAEVIKEPTFWFFFLMTLWLGWEALTRKNPWLFALTSILGTTSFLLRTEGIFVLPLIAVWLFLKDAKTLTITYKKRILFALVVFLTVPIILSPVMLYLEKKTGHLNLARAELIPRIVLSDVTMSEIKKNIDKIEVKLGENNQQAELEQIRLKVFLSLAKDHRIALIGIEAISKFLKVIPPLLIIPLIFGVLKRKKIKYHKEEELFLLSVLVIFLFILARYGIINIYIGTRHMMIPALMCLAWVGAGIFELEYRIRHISWLAKSNATRIVGFRSVGWVLMILIVFLLLPQTLASQRAEKISIKEAGIWIREHAPKDPVIMGQDNLGRIAFYANGVFLGLPRNQDLFDYAKKNRVNFMAVDEKDIEQSHPGLMQSLNPERFKEEVVIRKSSPNSTIKIYSVKY